MRALVSGKDAAVILPFDLVVGDVLHNGVGFLFIDKPDDLCDKLFRIIPEHIELIFPQILQNGNHSPPGQHGALGNLTDEVVLKVTGMDFAQCLGPGLHIAEGIPTVKFMLVHFILLAAHSCSVLQLRNKQPVIDMRDGFPNQFFTIERHRICILVVDLVPECLELRLGKVFVQRILFHLGFMTVHNHILEGAFIIDGLDQ